MKIKIPPYPSYQITDQGFDQDVASSSIEQSDASDLTSNKLLLTVIFKNNQKRVIKARAVKYNDNLYVAPFPNPVHLFLSVAIEHYNHSEQIKETNFPKCGKQIGNGLYFLDIAQNETHECYNHYIKYRASSIIMLISSLEAFLNHIIPNDFIYKTNSNGKQVQYKKIDIESTKVPFRDKLLNIIPQWQNNEFFWANFTKEKEAILSLYDIRRNIIHLKTNAEDDFERYFEAIDKMLDLDILYAINATIFFMNLVSYKFIQFEQE